MSNAAADAAFSPIQPENAAENDFAALVFPTLGDQLSGPRRDRDEERARLEQQWRARGHAAGYTEGLRSADEAVRARLAQLEAEHAELMRATALGRDHGLAVLHAAARALDQRTLPVLSDVEDTLLDAAIDLAEAIIGHALADEANAVRFALARADHAAAGARPVSHTVRLHPLDLAVLDERAAVHGGVTFVADAGLARGDAVSEFPDGYLDARIGSALARARAALGTGPA